MSNRVIENNQVLLAGKVLDGVEFSHETMGEAFYLFNLEIPRFSGQVDVLPLMISERLVDIEALVEGTYISIEGQYRSYNKVNESNGRNHLVLSVFVRSIEFLDSFALGSDNNQITLEGFICKQPIYRETPTGREICDGLLAVNRPYGKSDYIPTISWGRNARFMNTLNVGDKINAVGRIQSREYQKKFNDGTVEIRVAYEVSITRVVLSDEA